ncbi:BnaC08g19350D [Brassica napus]|uniref:BnaC08g19350D protein n=1 Tax=Brassica napus TaxID=3708 RepID=A0A078H4X6_BRANA|nr:BnaC08g19350D [Brassica napus]
MFPKWEFDVEDTLAENIIKLMFVKKPWNWTMDCWEVTGTWVNTKPAVVSPAKKKVVKKDSPRPQKKACKEAPAEASEEAAAEASEEAAAEATDAMRKGFGTCLKEIKYLSERVEAVEKKSESVNGTNAGRKSLAEDKDLQKEDARYLEKRDAAFALCRAKSDRTRKLAASQKSPYTANNTARVIISNRKLYPGYNPFAPIDKTKLKELADWLKSCSHYRTTLDKKPRKSTTWWYQILRTSLEWLEDCVIFYHIDAWINVLRKRYDANPQHFRSERICFLDYLFVQQWIFNFKDFKDSKLDHNGLGRRLPGGVWNYYAGTISSFCQSNKRHIVVFDSICSGISPEELDVVMEPFLYMVPYLLVECASSDEVRAQYSLEPFTYERPTNIPPARAGDCGVYTLKYIECHALGIEFSKKDFAKPNRKSMRDKMVVDIFQELPDVHEFENKYMDDIMGTYDV